MLTVTDAATARLAQLLDDVHALEGVAARLIVEGEDGIAMQPGTEEYGDTTYEHEGRIVLVIDEDTSLAIGDHILDVADRERELSLQPLV